MNRVKFVAGTKKEVPVNWEFVFEFEDDAIQGYIERDNYFYEGGMLDIIRDKVERGGTWIDAGANFGNHSVYFASMCPRCERVLAFEPFMDNYAYMVSNFMANEAWNAVPIYGALGMNQDWADTRREKQMRNSQMVVDFTRNRTVPVFRLDDMGIEGEVGLMKVDVEGMEFEVLMGARKILEKWHPELFVEIWQPEEMEKIEWLLSRHGYTRIERYNDAPTYHFKVV